MRAKTRGLPILDRVSSARARESARRRAPILGLASPSARAGATGLVASRRTRSTETGAACRGLLAPGRRSDGGHLRGPAGAGTAAGPGGGAHRDRAAGRSPGGPAPPPLRGRGVRPGGRVGRLRAALVRLALRLGPREVLRRDQTRVSLRPPRLRRRPRPAVGLRAGAGRAGGGHGRSALFIAAPLFLFPHSQAARALAAGAAHVYITNLQTHKTGGQHGILVLHVLALQALRSEGEGALCLLCTRAVVLSLYFGAALSKLKVSGPRWCDGGTLQKELYESAFLVPGAPWQLRATRAVARDRALCRVASTATVAVEFFAPLLMLMFPGFPFEWLYVPVHVAIYVLMGVDFVTWWVPVLLLLGLFAHEPPPVSVSSLAMPLYALAQFLVTLTSADLRGVKCFPFTCCPMFCDRKELFGEGEARGRSRTRRSRAC